MSLRNRIAAVASLSVALAVIAAAVGLYAAVRSDLRGEIDAALRSRAVAFAPAAGTVPAGKGHSRRLSAGGARVLGCAVSAGAGSPRPR